MSHSSPKDKKSATEDLYKIDSEKLPTIEMIDRFSHDTRLLESPKKILGNMFYQTVVFVLTHKQYDELRAKALWKKIVEHKNDLNDALGRDVGISVATLDYMTNIAKKISEPKIIEEGKSEWIAEVAIRDALTGLYLRDVFDITLEKKVSEAVRYNDPLSLIIADIDDFKKLNDTLGHPKGDEILSKVADLIVKNIRDADLAARYGGEELAVILPKTLIDAAFAAAERMRKDIQEHFKKDAGTTISIGVSCINNEIETADTLIKRADEALYQAKKEGKNRTGVKTQA
jgi:diguanylate cyclase (GGDEF)-like protein